MLGRNEEEIYYLMQPHLSTSASKPKGGGSDTFSQTEALWYAHTSDTSHR